MRLLPQNGSHTVRVALKNLGMKPIFGMSLVVFCFAAAAPVFRAQAPSSGQGNQAPSSQSPNTSQQPSKVQTQTNANPFPEDTSNVPVMPTNNIPGLPPGTEDSRKAPANLPVDDMDPVRSPEDEGAAAQGAEQNSSSSLAGMGDLLPGPDDETQPGGRNKRGSQVAPEHQETAAEDENVGSYYLGSKNWKAALSRYQSAMVLDPDNPEVYWGLAESQHHLGDFADARANYQKVVEYDPDSRHGKEARKALNDPEIENAKASTNVPSAAPAR